MWLSDYMDNYTTVGYNKPVQILGQIEILSGKMNLNVAAFKAGEEIGDRSGFNADATYGSYAYCRTQKGIADSLPQTSVDLEYTIDNKVKDGDTISNKLFNQYKPDGYVTSTWCTNLNPQDDIWSKDISVQNDLLVLKYEDDKKLTFYGKNVKNKNKDNVWIWDPFHSDTGQYPGASTWQSEDDYVPNYELSAKRNNEGYAFDKLIKLAVYYDGYYYVEDADYNRYKSQDGQNWEVYTKRMPLPDIVFENSQPSQWADKEVKRAYSLDVVPYKFKDKLVYTEDMTRERFADILASMLELAEKLPESGGVAFDDTTNENVLRLRNVKIISGYDEKTFGPKNSITRQEAAVLLYNTAKYMGYDFDEVTYSYKDDAEIASWAKEAVYQMNNICIMSGIGDDKFAPGLNYTNEQSIATILRLYDAL